MKTSAVTNPLATTGTNASAKTGTPADMPFDQVLSREVSTRNNASELTGANAKDGDAKTQVPQATQPTSSTNKPNEANTAEEGKTVSSAESPAAAADEGKLAASGDDAHEEEEATLDAASAELLALVVSLNQATTVQSTPRGAARADSEEGQDIVADVLTGGQTAEDAVPLIAAQQIDTSDPAVTTTTKEVATTEITTSGLASPSIDVTQAIDASRPTTPSQPIGMTQTAPMARAGSKPTTLAVDFRSRSTASTVSNTVDTQSDSAVDTATSLTQSKAETPAPETGTTKPLPAQMELAVATPKSQSPAMSQDALTTTAPINFASPSIAQHPQLQTAANAAANHLTPYVGNPGWDQALGQKVVWMVSNAQQSASLTLNPPDLGPLQVVVNVSNNQATANFIAAQPEVRQALENAMPKLRDMLGEAGIQLGQANVSAGTPNHQQGAFAQREQERQPTRDAGRTSDNIDTPVRVSHSQVVTGGQGLVDTFV